MSDSLRDRIAAVIYGSASQWDDYPWDALAEHIQALYLGQADAVIAELALEQEWGCPTNNCRCSHRYVTEWKINDE